MNCSRQRGVVPPGSRRGFARLLAAESTRFVIAGGFNTIVSWLIYVAMLIVMSYEWAFTASYILGVVLAYYVSSIFVFRESLNWKKAIRFPSVYIVQYAVGLATLHALIEWFDVPAALAPWPALVVTLPISFLMSRYIIKDPGRP